MGYNKSMWYEDDTDDKAERLIAALESSGVDVLRTKHGHTSHSKLFQYLLDKALEQIEPSVPPVIKRNKPPLPADIVYGDEDYNK